MYSEELYYPIIDSISELLRIIINVLTDAIRNVRDENKSKLLPIFVVLTFFSEKVVKRSAKFFVTELIPYVQLLIKERTNKEAKQISDIEANFISSLS